MKIDFFYLLKYVTLQNVMTAVRSWCIPLLLHHHGKDNISFFGRELFIDNYATKMQVHKYKPPKYDWDTEMR